MERDRALEVVSCLALPAQCGGQEPEVVVDGAVVGDGRAADHVRARKGSKSIVERCPELVGAASRRSLGGDRREPEVIPRSDPGACELLDGRSSEDLGGRFHLPRLGRDQRRPRRPRLHIRFAVRPQPTKAAASSAESRQLPALDVVDPEGVCVPRLLSPLAGGGDQLLGTVEHSAEQGR